MNWMGQAQYAAVTMAPGVTGTAAMDVSAPRISCGDGHSPFTALGMSPGGTPELSGLAEIPEDFIQNLNSTGPSQFGQLLKSGTLGGGMELMDLLSDDVAAR